GEESLQTVVIRLKNRIELVVVAAGASVRQAHEDSAHGVGDVVQDLLAAEYRVGEVALVRPEAIQTRGYLGRRIARKKLIPGDLLADKTVVGFVGVERLDHIIAIAPHIRARLVAFEAGGVGVASQVKPMTAPALSVLRRGKQPVHNLGESVRGTVGQKRLRLLGGWRQTDEIEGGAAEQRDLIRGRAGLEVLLLELGQDEGVDGSAHPALVLYRGYGRLDHFLEGPIATL